MYIHIYFSWFEGPGVYEYAQVYVYAFYMYDLHWTSFPAKYDYLHLLEAV